METQSFPAWKRSSRCESSACLEVARVGGAMFIRDSKNPNGPVLQFPEVAWRDFLNALRQGEFEH